MGTFHQATAKFVFNIERKGPTHETLCVLVVQSCLTLCNPMDSIPPGFSVPGILQARILEGILYPFSRGIFLRCRQILYQLSYQGSPEGRVSGLVAKSCPTLCDPMDCSLPGSSVHGISQARILEWVAISFCQGSSWPRNQTQVSWIVSRFFTDWGRVNCVNFFLP